MNLALMFMIIIAFNVILCAIKNIFTAREIPFAASLSTAIQAAFNNIVTIYTVADFPMWQKCIISLVVNFIFTYFVIISMNKLNRNRLWKIEFTCYTSDSKEIIKKLNSIEAQFSWLEFGKHMKFECYSRNHKETKAIKEIISNYNIKYFITSSGGVL